jgi:hypothetical protein
MASLVFKFAAGRRHLSLQIVPYAATTANDLVGVSDEGQTREGVFSFALHIDSPFMKYELNRNGSSPDGSDR